MGPCGFIWCQGEGKNLTYAPLVLQMVWKCHRKWKKGPFLLFCGQNLCFFPPFSVHWSLRLEAKCWRLTERLRLDVLARQANFMFSQRATWLMGRSILTDWMLVTLIPSRFDGTESIAFHNGTWANLIAVMENKQWRKKINTFAF